MNETHLAHYADILVDIGLHIIPGDNVSVRLSPEALPLARLVASRAYRRGAHRIYLDVEDVAMTRARYLYAPDEAFLEYPDFDIEIELKRAQNRTHRLTLYAPDPDTYKGLDNERLSRWVRVVDQALKPIDDLVANNTVKWCVALVPSQRWAETLFPDDAPADALEKTWNQLLALTRADRDDPIAAWQAHDERLKTLERQLNTYRFRTLRYTGPGTDFAIDLLEHHRWVGGSSAYGDNESFMANIPTEECFTTPDRTSANGVLTLTRPLFIRSQRIDGVRLTFKDGQVVDVKADTGLDRLTELLDRDEGARFLGEVALVDSDSPIHQSQHLYQVTLLDENAACHLALGAAYAECWPQSQALSEAEKKAAGMNDSCIHVDFMVGSEALDIDGVCHDGTIVPVMRRGHIVLNSPD